MLLEPAVTLALVADRVPPALCRPERVERARVRARGSCWSWCILESRLGHDATERVDLLVCADRRERGSDAALRAELSTTDPDRAGLHDFIRSWTAPGSVLDREVPLCWAEFDLPDAPARPPFVQFCVARNYPLTRPDPILRPEQLYALAREGLESFLPRAPGAAALAALRRAAERLPAEAFFLHLGAMPARADPQNIRAIAVLRPPEVERWLTGIGWRGAPRQLATLLRLTAPGQAQLSVQVDIGDEVGPRVGIEFARATRDGTGAHWRAFVRRLESAGLCTSDQGVAALDWIGTTSHNLPGYSTRVAVERSLDIKVVLEGDGSIAAKAYLCVCPRRSIFPRGRGCE